MRALEARTIAIDDYLSLAGINPSKQTKGGRELWYSSPIRQGDTHPSFKVDKVKNLWFDFGLAKGGNIIDLVCELQHATVSEALAILDKTGLYSKHTSFSSASSIKSPIFFQGSVFNSEAEVFQSHVINHLQSDSELKKFAGEKEKFCAFEVLRVSDINQASLIKLLQERRIRLDIAKKYLQQVHYKPRESVNSFYALALPCGDGFEARSAFFKGFIGTKKDITKINLKNKQSLSIFEGFMDFLSFLTYYGITNFQNSVIILNSINLRKRALEEIKNYNFSKIYLFLDNDEAGESTTDFFNLTIDNIPIIDKSFLYENYNDFNDMLREEQKNDSTQLK